MGKLGFLILGLIVLLAAALRLYLLGVIPHGLYFDEASIGNNALWIATKGTDEQGASYPLWFPAFGEYKMPVYIYVTAIAVKLLGATNVAVRIFSVISGILTILSFFFLVRELCRDSLLPYKNALPYVTALLLAISTWHLQFSRAGFEATPAALLYITGLLFALLFWRKKILWTLGLAVLCFVLSMYTYDGYRAITPLTVVGLALLGFWKEKKLRKLLVGGLIAFLVLLVPLITFNLTPEGLARFSQVSAFNSLAHAPFLQKLLLYPATYLHNYLSYFSLSFLFGNGDGIARHQLIGFGPLLYWQLPVLLVGIIALLKTKMTRLKVLTFALLLLAPVAAALALPSPHTLRSLLMVFPLCILLAIGSLVIVHVLRKQPVILLLFLLVIGYETVRYFHIYYGQYAVNSALDWGGEYQAVVTKAQTLQNVYPHIVVSDKLGFATSEYFGYYSNATLHPIVVSKDWKKPVDWGNEQYLYITPHTKKAMAGTLLNTVYLPNNNHDTFAQFWRMP